MLLTVYKIYEICKRNNIPEDAKVFMETNFNCQVPVEIVCYSVEDNVVYLLQNRNDLDKLEAKGIVKLL